MPCCSTETCSDTLRQDYLLFYVNTWWHTMPHLYHPCPFRLSLDNCRTGFLLKCPPFVQFLIKKWSVLIVACDRSWIRVMYLYLYLSLSLSFYRCMGQKLDQWAVFVFVFVIVFLIVACDRSWIGAMPEWFWRRNSGVDYRPQPKPKHGRLFRPDSHNI